MNTRSKGKVVKRKHRWDTVKGKAVSVRFTDAEYLMLARRASARGLSVGNYLKWLSRSTYERDGALEVSE